MKIQKNIEWLKIFIDSVDDLVPLHKVKRVMGYKVSAKKEEGGYASIVRTGNKYSINLKLTNNYREKGKRLRRNTHLATILESLAHELGHIHFWEHDSDHFELTGKILVRFSKVMKKIGVKNTYGRIKF